MARYKPYSYEHIPIHFKDQILPGTFEYTLNYMIDDEVDLSVFATRYRNDETGAPAYDPAILLKILLFADSRGITSSRQIARCCHENVVFMALSADTRPHFTTIADFVSRMEQQVASLYQDVLLVCDELGLICTTWCTRSGRFSGMGRFSPSSRGKPTTLRPTPGRRGRLSEETGPILDLATW